MESRGAWPNKMLPQEANNSPSVNPGRDFNDFILTWMPAQEEGFEFLCSQGFLCDMR